MLPPNSSEIKLEYKAKSRGSKIVTEFAKRGLIHAIINIEKSRFEILNTVYLENAWCLVYEILHQSIKVIQLVFSLMAC